MLKPIRVKRLSDFVPEAIGPVAARQGFAGGEVLARWAAIVGPEIAAVAAPVKLQTPRGKSSDPDAAQNRSTLTLRVEGAFALEIQHRSREIIERVNAHLGWPYVGQVKIRQGSLASGSGRPPRRAAPPATEAERVAARAAAASVEDPELAEALARLGEAALAAARTPRRG
ncbi:DUF721 domain-containing protein [Chelatococcus sambhunathii]|uniref:DUF721 domain-containing protein n=1 Tax=Chelatococcus sambhunathii TaxID=363953 RepID=A0ABU1DIB9_9HYPH|nr:DciA family protein [Chelatococcus sambhunathii]MDR4307862.1 DUF721 domain-containing protein [Chelatococcus sambhunathii]